ncbi:hypothetical protein MKX03_003088 [Papaver bracteatum]|nr:hypothetical protein MKX03_003088 [Papaver bracteatum]
MSVRNSLKQMQHRWMMDNVSQQLKEQNNGAPIIAVNEKPNIDINSQCQKVLHDENVSFDRDPLISFHLIFHMLYLSRWLRFNTFKEYCACYVVNIVGT